MTRTIHAVRLVAGDKRIPRALRWCIAPGLLPVPGPFDEIVLAVVALPLFIFYRGLMREAWERAGERLPAGDHNAAASSSGVVTGDLQTKRSQT